jgi:hypothetical protein
MSCRIFAPKYCRAWREWDCAKKFDASARAQNCHAMTGGIGARPPPF